MTAALYSLWKYSRLHPAVCRSCWKIRWSQPTDTPVSALSDVYLKRQTLRVLLCSLSSDDASIYECFGALCLSGPSDCWIPWLQHAAAQIELHEVWRARAHGAIAIYSHC